MLVTLLIMCLTVRKFSTRVRMSFTMWRLRIPVRLRRMVRWRRSVGGVVTLLCLRRLRLCVVFGVIRLLVLMWVLMITRLSCLTLRSPRFVRVFRRVVWLAMLCCCRCVGFRVLTCVLFVLVLTVSCRVRFCRNIVRRIIRLRIRVGRLVVLSRLSIRMIRILIVIVILLRRLLGVLVRSRVWIGLRLRGVRVTVLWCRWVKMWCDL